MKYGFGVDLGGTTAKLAFFSEAGELLGKWEIPTDIENDGANILPDIANAIADYIARNGLAKEQILGIGIGVPGAVTGNGQVNRCTNLGWGVFNIHQALGELTGLPVAAGNDANVAALGECWKGGGQGCRNVVMVTFGTGVGGGVVVDGKIVSGAHGAAGEIGHIILNREETEYCTCGKRGCAEQYCSATGIVRMMKKYLINNVEPSALRGTDFTCKDVFDAAAQGDAAATAVLEQVYAYMGEFIADTCCVIDPEMVVLGGGVSRAGQPLLRGIEQNFQKYCFHACQDTKFALATLGNDAGVYGAFKLLLDTIND